MLVTCPICLSIFKLPDSDNPDLKMRCSICSNVFSLKEIETLPDNILSNDNAGLESFSLDSPIATIHVPNKGHKTFIRFMLILLFLLVFILGMLWSFTNHLDIITRIFSDEKIEVIEKQNKEVSELFQRVRLLELAHVRQFIVPNSENEKFEKITVIEGRIINKFAELRGFIKVEATLFDAENNPLEQKTQMAGPKVSLFQLQVLNESELEQALRDSFAILDANTNIKPQESVPFMFLFYNPPEEAVNFNVKIIDAQISEPEKIEE